MNLAAAATETMRRRGAIRLCLPRSHSYCPRHHPWWPGPVNWGFEGQDIRTVRANSIVRTTTVVSCDHRTSRSVTITPAVNVVERPGEQRRRLREPGRAEQPGEGGPEQVLGLLGAEQELGPQRLPERPDA